MPPDPSGRALARVPRIFPHRDVPRAAAPPRTGSTPGTTPSAGGRPDSATTTTSPLATASTATAGPAHAPSALFTALIFATSRHLQGGGGRRRAERNRYRPGEPGLRRRRRGRPGHCEYQRHGVRRGGRRAAVFCPVPPRRAAPWRRKRRRSSSPHLHAGPGLPPCLNLRRQSPRPTRASGALGPAPRGAATARTTPTSRRGR